MEQRIKEHGSDSEYIHPGAAFLLISLIAVIPVFVALLARQINPIYWEPILQYTVFTLWFVIAFIAIIQRC